MKHSRPIWVWPDRSWTDSVEERTDMEQYMPDDWELVIIPSEWNEDEIDTYVSQL